MRQEWLNVLGLGIDFFGFCLLLREWWLAFFHESRRLQLEAQQAWERSVRQMHHQHAPESHRAHLDASSRMHEEMQFRAAQSAHKATLGARKSVFIAATVLIVLGFALQILGSIPGCCEPWIVPQS